MAKTIKSEASQISESLKGSKGAPSADATRQIQQTDKLARAYQELSFAESENAKRLAEVNAKRQEATRIAKLEEQFHRSAIGSYDRLSAQYSLNKIRLNAMSKAMRENTEVGKALEKQTREIYEEMNRLQVATGKHTLNVGNYASAFRGLNVATQQIVRELPSLTMSANQFFLAISNNLPMFVDEFARLRNEGNSLPTVLKATLKSLVSWQSMLVLGITILSQYGSKIADWVKGLFTAEKKSEDLRKKLLELRSEIEKGASSAGNSIVKYKQLQSAWNDLGGDLQKQNQFIKTNANEFNELGLKVKSASDAERVFVEQSDDIIDALGKRAMAQAALTEASKAYGEVVVATIEQERIAAEKSELLAKRASTPRLAQEMKLNVASGEYEFVTTTNSEYERLTSLIDEADRKAAELSKKIAESNSRASSALEIAKQANVEADKFLDDTTTKTDSGATTKSNWRDYIPTVDLKAIEERNKRRIELERKAQDEELKFIDDEWERRRLQTNYQYEREIEDLQNYLDRNEDLTVHERERINARILLLSVDQGRALAKITEEQSVWELEQQQKGIDLRLRAVEEGSEAEYKLLLERNRVALQIALAKNALLAEAERQSVADIIAAFDAEFAKIVGKRTEDIEADTKKAAEEKAKKIAGAFSTAKNAISEFSKNSSEAIESMRSIFNMPFGKDGETLADKLGLSQPALESMSMVAGSVVGILQDIAAARVEEADKAVEASRREIDAARDALQAEIAARNEGYAHNVAQARKELELAKRTEKQALAEKQRAQRQQLVMDSISQASNLVTASALVWSQLGFPWAIAAIGSMFASFAASKILAARATRETYGDGTVELLHGGSHQSGNDIDLGTKPDGTRRRAEGGEYFAVFNKRASRNRGALITDVVNSLNNGTFAQKYQRAYDMGGGIMLNVGGSSPDLRRLSDDVRKIKEQNERRTYLDSEGNVVEVYKNVKRVIKKC
ncbi:MAG: hypothetical protein IIW53_04825 [Rikenellaceae bacterium]|nr:hypothetical protein [Rikenellaceae bacterium]MBQ5853400.1 hypothetical protein [Rikenellaceae bacterium]